MKLSLGNRLACILDASGILGAEVSNAELAASEHFAKRVERPYIGVGAAEDGVRVRDDLGWRGWLQWGRRSIAGLRHR